MLLLTHVRGGDFAEANLLSVLQNGSVVRIL